MSSFRGCGHLCVVCWMFSAASLRSFFFFFLMLRRPPRSPLFPYPTLFRSEVLDFSFPNQVLPRSRHVFDRHIRVNTVLIEQIDNVGPESLERAIGNLLDVLRPAVEARKGSKVEPELSRDHHLVPEGSKCFAHELFIGERAVGLGGVEEGDAAFD